jgi:hypothetical protein
VTGTGTDAGGRLYLYDARWDRIVAFDKTDGAYVAQWKPAPDTPSMADVRGMYVVRGKKKNDPDTLYWVTPDGLFRSALSTRAAPAPAASGQPASRAGGRDTEP